MLWKGPHGLRDVTSPSRPLAVHGKPAAIEEMLDARWQMYRVTMKQRSRNFSQKNLARSLQAMFALCSRQGAMVPAQEPVLGADFGSDCVAPRILLNTVQGLEFQAARAGCDVEGAGDAGDRAVCAATTE